MGWMPLIVKKDGELCKNNILDLLFFTSMRMVRLDQGEEIALAC